jgi:hypothetical protein
VKLKAGQFKENVVRNSMHAPFVRTSTTSGDGFSLPRQPAMCTCTKDVDGGSGHAFYQTLSNCRIGSAHGAQHGAASSLL